jgi:5-(carboxyamino)imidazole ribonucleotide mutase
MAIGKAGARNAALFALEILGITEPEIQARLLAYKKQMRCKIKNIRLKV